MCKKLIAITMMVACLISLAACGSSNTIDLNDPAYADLRAVANSVMDATNEGDFQAIYELFREDVKASLSAEDLALTMQPIMEAAGAFVEYQQVVAVSETIQETAEAYTAVVFVCSYENTDLTFTVSMDADLAVIGYNVR